MSVTLLSLAVACIHVLQPCFMKDDLKIVHTEIHLNGIAYYNMGISDLFHMADSVLVYGYKKALPTLHHTLQTKHSRNSDVNRCVTYPEIYL